MSVAFSVFIAGLIAAIGLAVVSLSRRGPDPADPEPAERRLVAFVGRHPRLRTALAHSDRRVAGGAAVVVVLAVVWAAGTFVGWVFDTVDTDRGFARWDEAVAEWGSENATSTSTDVLTVITRFGETPYLLVGMGLIGIVDLVRRRNPEVMLFFATVGLGVSLVSNGIKWIVMRDRPAVEHLVEAGGSSFPSGHSAAAAACWAAIVYVLARGLPQRARSLAFGGAIGIAVLVAASRALLGVHWLTDVIAGVVVGWTWFFVMGVVFGGRRQRLGDPAERVETLDAADRPDVDVSSPQEREVREMEVQR